MNFRNLKRLLKLKGFNRSKTLLYLTYLSSFVLFALLGGILLVLVLFAVFSRQLPNPNQLLNRSTDLSTKLLDRNGVSVFEVFGEKNRSIITLDKVTPNIVHATLAVEDAGFYGHQGIDLRGVLRAVKNTLIGSGLQGGSTITQQVVKNALLTQDRTISRKIKEFILSLQLENKYSKDQILQMYLNETPYGGQNYGVLTASKAYFDTDPSNLSVAQSAFLAGLPQRPSYYSPYSSNPSAGLERKDYVLYLMKERGWLDASGVRHYLSKEDYLKARTEKLVFKSASQSFKAPHFVFYVKQLLADLYGEDEVEQGGLIVRTSIDLKTQELAEKIVKEEVDKAKTLNVGNGSLVAIDPKTGEILAMVGSKDYFGSLEPEGCVSGTTGVGSCDFEPNFNVSIAKRQPGSSIKPLTYATMLSHGYTASFPFLDVPTVFPKADAGKDYKPVNYDGKFRGPMSLRKSLGNSINIPAVKALKIVGVDQLLETAKKTGIKTLNNPARYGLALTLGGGETKLLEMTGAFATFAAKGVHRDPIAILEVKDSAGKLIYKHQDSGGDKVLGEDVAFIISDILSDDGARSEVFGFGSLLNIPGRKVAVKTGTTDDKRDNYFMAFTPSISLGVWVGNNNNAPMNPYISSGITGATPIGHRFLVEYLKDKQSDKFEPPKNVKKLTVDVLTGMLPFKDEKTRPEWFVNGTEPTAISEWFREIEVCKSDGKISNDSCKKAEKTKVKTFVKITAELPEWQVDADKWVKENYAGDSKYFPPSTTSKLYFDSDGNPNEDGDPSVEIVGRKDGDIVPLSFRLEAEVSSPHTITRVKIFLDGVEITTDTSTPYGYDFVFTFDQQGDHEFEVRAEDSKGKEGSTKIKLKISS